MVEVKKDFLETKTCSLRPEHEQSWSKRSRSQSGKEITTPRVLSVGYSGAESLRQGRIAPESRDATTKIEKD
jgi:hypothetical protein